MTQPWFRFYRAALHNPKVLRLTDKLHRAWVNLLCCTDDDGYLPGAEDIALILRQPRKAASVTLGHLIVAGFFVQEGQGEESRIRAHDWSDHQKRSDVSNERVAKYRSAIRESGSSLNAYAKHRSLVFGRDGHACIYCGSVEQLVLDHVVPVSKGGSHGPENLATACKRCNSGKAGRNPFEAGLSFRDEKFDRFCRDAVTRVTVTVTPPDTDTDTEAEQQRKAEAPQPFPVDRVVAALGGDMNDPKWHHAPAHVRRWMDLGYDLERHILPVIAERSAGKNIGHLKYFDGALADRFAEKPMARAAATVTPPANRAVALRRAQAAQDGTWGHDWGPRRGEPGCLIPEDVWAEIDKRRAA